MGHREARTSRSQEDHFGLWLDRPLGSFEEG
jgi:hypothetical protein